MIREVYAAGYRSLRAIRFPIDRLSIFVGANGTGKTNLYRALQLLQASALGTFSHELAAEGGMASAIWAGKRRDRRGAIITLGVVFDTDQIDGRRPTYSYEISAGFASHTENGTRMRIGAAFLDEPQVKDERLIIGVGKRQITMLERRGPSATVRNEDGLRTVLGTELMASETALGALADPTLSPELHAVRQTMSDWRFYHEFRTDSASPLRRPCLAVTSPTLSSDGSNLAAVFATLVHIREDTAILDRVIDDAFPGAQLVVPEPGRVASFGMIFQDHPKRVFEIGELSDGTLRYLALAGALLAYRLPAFIALNEPETSLHPDLLPSLARLIASASTRTQIWLVTHSEQLARALANCGQVEPRTVLKRNGETWIDGLQLAGTFASD
ncbi:MAG TPA: AAA family ATPase [Mycobacterium sp.]|nr:AAA family ATPase [Mycobacterium sp.]